MIEFRQQGKVLCKQIDILFIAVLATIANADSWTEVEAFAEAREEWFKKYIEFDHGISLHYTFERVFENIDSEAFNKAFIDWVNSRVRKNSSAVNQSILKKIALNILKQEKVITKKTSLKIKRYKACLNE